MVSQPSAPARAATRPSAPRIPVATWSPRMRIAPSGSISTAAEPVARPTLSSASPVSSDTTRNAVRDASVSP